MKQAESPIACNLGALNGAEQHRRAELAHAIVTRAAATVETADGFALQLEDDPALLRDAVDWIRLERACCPFLYFALSFDPEAGPLWLRLGGRAGVKEFLAAAGLAASHRLGATCGCA
jgi:hypothetical protein